MPHHTPLVATIVGGLVIAFVLGALANRLRLSPLVGYLLAGVLVGPFTPGFVADQGIALELAEIGVILLMFGVGLHFSLDDLLAVKNIAIPGAIGQIAVATLLGMALAHGLGWTLGAGLVFGLALSVASTVVLLRALQERHILETQRGRIAVGWLIVEDLAMVLTLVLLPVFAGLLTSDATAVLDWGSLLGTIGITIGKVVAFVALMLVVGRRVVPWLLHEIAHSGSRELFRLGVLAIALGIAYGASVLFDVSFALGAFFAGMILSESPLAHRAAQESLPLRDAFAVLFFVSVGMLFDPMILVRQPLSVLATLLIIVFGKSIAAFFIVRLFGHPVRTAFTISASLAQIGEFSFILAGLGVGLKLLPEEGRDLILAGAILSILINPFAFGILDRLTREQERPPAEKAPAEPRPGEVAQGAAPAAKAARPAEAETELDFEPTSLTNHAVLIGFGRVGSMVGEALIASGRPLVVVEEDDGVVDRLRERGIEAIKGVLEPEVLISATNVAAAKWLLLAIPNAFEAGQIVAQAREANPSIEIVARAHSDAEVEHLKQFGANVVIMGEREIAKAMIEHTSAAGPVTTRTRSDSQAAAGA